MGVISTFLSVFIPLLHVAPLFVFFWGLSMYMFNPADRELRKKGIDIMMVGVIIMLFVVVIWALISFL